MKTLGTSFGLAAFNAGMALLVGILTARWAGPNAQGTLATIATVSAVFTLVFSFGAGTALRLAGHARELPRVKAFLLISVMGAAGAGLGTAIVSLVLGFGPAVSLAAGGVGAMMLLGRQASDYVQACGRVFLSIASVGVGAAAQLATVVLWRLAADVDLMACVASVFCGALVQGGVCIALVGGKLEMGSESPSQVAKQLVRVGWPTLGFGIGLLILQRVDRLLVTLLAGTVQNGVYSVAATVGEGARLAAMVVSQVLFVRVTSEGVISRATAMLAAMTVGVQAAASVVLALFSGSLVTRIFGVSYASAASILPWLLLAECLMAAALMGARMLMGMGRVRYVSGVTAAAAVLSALVYAPLIHYFGAPGAAYASCVLYAGYALMIVFPVTKLGLMRTRAQLPE